MNIIDLLKVHRMMPRKEAGIFLLQTVCKGKQERLLNTELHKFCDSTPALTDGEFADIINYAIQYYENAFVPTAGDCVCLKIGNKKFVSGIYADIHYADFEKHNSTSFAIITDLFVQSKDPNLTKVELDYYQSGRYLSSYMVAMTYKSNISFSESVWYEIGIEVKLPSPYKEYNLLTNYNGWVRRKNEVNGIYA